MFFKFERQLRFFLPTRDMNSIWNDKPNHVILMARGTKNHIQFVEVMIGEKRPCQRHKQKFNNSSDKLT